MPEHRRYPELLRSRSYQACKQVSRYLDDYRLDGVIGLFPVVGDAVGQGFNAVYLYVAAVKLRSWRLSLVVLCNGLIDTVIGLIPFLGAVLDFFYHANKRNLALIEGFATGDAEVVREVNRRALVSLGLIALLLVSAYWLAKLAWAVLIYLWQSATGLF
ncbi:DUF4112 domain-containing protein [Conchiformibius steedae]|uniref:DUF4112 domain-containing protein n=1 Tax=Conchiformibius steedae TaxID=153493 RepID=A0A3P2A878_9NEIS|nr:DUF4112 domain-containing protein [Conchiformibius steedae]RRD91702.1 DUF4112 domain-containing protein [Conchiformibius steedae]